MIDRPPLDARTRRPEPGPAGRPLPHPSPFRLERALGATSGLATLVALLALFAAGLWAFLATGGGPRPPLAAGARLALLRVFFAAMEIALVAQALDATLAARRTPPDAVDAPVARRRHAARALRAAGFALIGLTALVAVTPAAAALLPPAVLARLASALVAAGAGCALAGLVVTWRARRR